MIHFIETHGFEVVISYYVFASIISTMPPLPSNASYWSSWGYGALHAFASDWKHALEMTKQLPQEPNTIQTTMEVKQKIVENKPITPEPPKE